MNSRERVLCALRHEEPDRVPIDLGGTVVTGISAVAYRRLRSYVGLTNLNVRVIDVYQQIAHVDEEFSRFAKSDVRALMIRPKKFKPGNLSDGSPCEVPEKWNPQYQDDGSQVVRNRRGEITAIMPPTGLYFEPVSGALRDCHTLADLDRCVEDIVGFDLPGFLDMSFEELASYAKALREQTNCILVGTNFSCHIFAACQSLRGWDLFLLDLLERPALAEALMDRLVHAYRERFDRYWAAVGPYVDVVEVEDDLGTQVAPILSPDLYRKRVKPYHQKLYSHIKKNSGAFVFLHTCGSVYQLIPDLIEAGIDILNPVQVSAEGMDTRRLKHEFGDDLVFWGGGCDTQRILPRGTKEEIRDEVKRRIDDLAPGGGFVFAQVHNIQEDVPPENIVAMLEAAWEFGRGK